MDESGKVIGPANVAPPTPKGGLSARAARFGLRTQPAFDMARQTLGILLGYREKGSPAGNHVPAAFTRQTIEAPRKPGRRGRPDRFYAEIAQAYVNAIADGDRAPIRAVTRRLSDDGQHYSEAAVRDLVHAARRRELLTKPPRGKSGGRLTKKAEAVLAGEISPSPGTP